MVNSGARKEEKRAAEALYRQALNAYNEALVYQDETSLSSPIEGEVQTVNFEAGEMVSAGFPVVTLVDLNTCHVLISLREDKFSTVEMGQVVKADIPALNLKKSSLKVTRIAPMADFATWRGTNQKGEYDLRTFEIELTPLSEIDGLRPGMTVRVSI